MQESKYYTPSLEEFHIGFECEMKQGNIWEQYSVENNDCFGDLGGDGYRVKYLDKEDIEFLGFISDYERAWGDVKMCFIGDFCAMDYLIPERSLRIKSKEGIIFKGNIKNKSELIKLMKQLNINKKEEV